MDGSGDRPDSKTWILSASCKVEAAGSMFEQLQVHGWASGVRGNQTDHRARDAPVGTACRGPPWSLASPCELTSPRRFLLTCRIRPPLPPHPPSPPVRAGLTLTVGGLAIPAARMLAAIPGEDGRAKMATRQPFAGLRQICGHPPAWRDGEGQSEWACRGPCPPARLAVIGNSPGTGRGGQQSATSGFAAAGTGQHRPAIKPTQEGERLARGGVGTARTRIQLPARAPAFTRPGRAAGPGDARLAPRVEPALAGWAGWRRQR